MEKSVLKKVLGSTDDFKDQKTEGAHGREAEKM